MPEGLRELYIDELKDLYSAENQLVKALPQMAKAASSDKLREGLVLAVRLVCEPIRTCCIDT